MNSFFAKMSVVGLAVGGLLLAACGDDKGSSSFDMEESFDVVLTKARYDYRSKDSTLIVKKPVCKESDIGQLIWKEDDFELRDTLKAYLNKNTAMIVEKGVTEPVRYGFDGGKFPVGFWSSPEEQKSNIQSGLRFKKGGKLNKVVHYGGTCYAQDFKTNLFDENPSMAKSEQFLLDFYREFLADPEKELDEKSVLNNVKVEDDCDQLILFDVVTVELDELNESSGELTVSYKKGRSCSFEFSFRYAINEKDCKAAYEEFGKDKQAKEFHFEDYSTVLKYKDGEYCTDKLVAEMKEGESIHKTKKKSAAVAPSGKDFAKAIVDLVISGMK